MLFITYLLYYKHYQDLLPNKKNPHANLCLIIFTVFWVTAWEISVFLSIMSIFSDNTHTQFLPSAILIGNIVCFPVIPQDLSGLALLHFLCFDCDFEMCPASHPVDHRDLVTCDCSVHHLIMFVWAFGGSKVVDDLVVVLEYHVPGFFKGRQSFQHQKPCWLRSMTQCKKNPRSIKIKGLFAPGKTFLPLMEQNLMMQ